MPSGMPGGVYPLMVSPMVKMASVVYPLFVNLVERLVPHWPVRQSAAPGRATCRGRGG